MRCDACGKEITYETVFESGLLCVCLDQEECIAEFSGWNIPHEPLSEDVKEETK